jgi:hypothetical protein
MAAVVIIAWSGLFSVFMFYPLKALGRLRVSESVELQGLDVAEHDEGACTLQLLLPLLCYTCANSPVPGPDFTGDNYGEEHQDAFAQAMHNLKGRGPESYGSASTAYSKAVV